MSKYLGVQLAWHLSVSAFFYFWQKEKVLVCCWQCNYFAQDQRWSGDLAFSFHYYNLRNINLNTMAVQCT